MAMVSSVQFWVSQNQNSPFASLSSPSHSEPNFSSTQNPNFLSLPHLDLQVLGTFRHGKCFAFASDFFFFFIRGSIFYYTVPQILNLCFIYFLILLFIHVQLIFCYRNFWVSLLIGLIFFLFYFEFNYFDVVIIDEILKLRCVKLNDLFLVYLCCLLWYGLW